MRGYIEELAGELFAGLTGDERLLIGFMGEDTDFVRFNQGRVRQAGRVQQQELSLRLVDGGRHAGVDRNLTGDRAEDAGLLRADLAALRETLPLLAPDPALLIGWEEAPREREVAGALPPVGEVVADVVGAAAGEGGVGAVDLVGFYGGGRIRRGVLASTGLRHWFDAPSLALDWSLHLPPRDGERRAVKHILGGTSWDRAAFLQKMAQGRAQLEALHLPIRPVQPGECRAWLAPDAVAELLYLSSGGFGAMARHTRSSVWMRQIAAEQAGQGLHPGVSLTEETISGLGAPFQQDGFGRPDRVKLVAGGRIGAPLVSARSAGELGLTCNGAGEWESPESLEMAGGDLPDAEVLAAIGTGLYVSNLWYCNVSDRSGGRVTGLTRFASLWVEEGRVVGPVPTMRFDDTLGRMFGSEVERIGARVEWIPSTDSYGWRSTASWRLPGLLLRSFRLVL